MEGRAKPSQGRVTNICPASVLGVTGAPRGEIFYLHRYLAEGQAERKKRFPQVHGATGRDDSNVIKAEEPWH